MGKPVVGVATLSFGIITLKALANFSPGLLQPWVQEMLKRFFATLKELRLLCGANRDTTLSGLRFREEMRFVPGFQSKPWAGTRQRFQRNDRGRLNVSTQNLERPATSRPLGFCGNKRLQR